MLYHSLGEVSILLWGRTSSVIFVHCDLSLEWVDFFKEEKSTTNPVDYRVHFHLHFLDLPSQIPYHLILYPKEGRGLEISDFELQGFGLLFLYKMPGFPKHQSALLEAHVPSRKNSIPTVNLANR